MAAKSEGTAAVSQGRVFFPLPAGFHENKSQKSVALREDAPVPQGHPGKLSGH